MLQTLRIAREWLWKVVGCAKRINYISVFMKQETILFEQIQQFVSSDIVVTTTENGKFIGNPGVNQELKES